MVSLSVVKASNALIATELPSKLVAVLVGATSGIGEYTLKALAKHAAEPRLYFTGRNAAAGKRIEEECHALNPKGEYIFKKADTSLLRNVDTMCAEIAKHESSLHLLVLSQGTLDTSQSKHLANDALLPSANVQPSHRRGPRPCDGHGILCTCSLHLQLCAAAGAS